jgi:hypothetical protein
MPKLVTRSPKYSLHKASGQAVVKFGGRVHYLGPFGTPESKAKYQSLIAKWASGQGKQVAMIPLVAETPNEPLAVTELILRFWTHAEKHYRKNGEPTDELACYRAVLKHLRAACGQMPAKDFGPGMLDTVRQRMIEAGNSRGYINKQVRTHRTVDLKSSCSHLEDG